jgi:hypothetical protein
MLASSLRREEMMRHSKLSRATLRILPTLLRGWVILWVLLVPLFHVHPEADHHHGEAGHVHGGTVHTVFSGDLDGEFGSHGKVAHASDALSDHSSHTWQGHSELGFSLLSDSSDRKVFKPLLTQMILVAVAVMCTPEFCDSTKQDIAPVPSSTLFIHELPSRAPPSLLV